MFFLVFREGTRCVVTSPTRTGSSSTRRMGELLWSVVHSSTTLIQSAVGIFLFVQKPAGGAGCAGGPGSLHLPPHQPEVRLPGGRRSVAAAGEQHQQVRPDFSGVFECVLIITFNGLDHMCRAQHLQARLRESLHHIVLLFYSIIVL